MPVEAHQAPAARTGKFPRARTGLRYSQFNGRFFTKHGVRFRAGIEMGANESIKQAVQAGMGLFLSLHSTELELGTGRLAVLNVEHFPVVRHWYIVHRQNKHLSSAAQAFKLFLLTEAERLAAPATGAKQKS